MNDHIADKTLEDHKHLLLEVQNRAAIAYFAAANNNHSLYNSLKKILSMNEIDPESVGEQADGPDDEKNDNINLVANKLLKNFQANLLKKIKNKNQDKVTRSVGGAANFGNEDEKMQFLEDCFEKMLYQYDFLTVVMYPDLKNRRHFVHDAWMIAKLTENFELKMTISKDPYFYITRDDIFQLIKTHDNDIIEYMLKISVSLQIEEDLSYKLVAIKHAQVDAKQQTPVQLVDFISVMVLNKRVDNYDVDSPILFNHNHIVKFLERHKQFMNPEEIIKVFIMSRKFRLAIKYLRDTGDQFTIDYFTMALVYNAYDIAFYLFATFEDAIVYDFQKSIEALVKSYKGSNRFLKAKLHMTKLLLPIFTFNGANSFLQEITYRINEPSLENNIFSHTSNPLMCMCLLYEFFILLTQKFFSLNNICR